MIESGAVIVLVVLVAIILLVAVAVGYVIGKDRAILSQHVFAEDVPMPTSDFEEGVDDFEEPALKIDPSNPPSWKVYNPPPGKQAPFCTCHGRPLARGENVLMWPDPDEGGYRLFHEGFIKGMVPPRG